MIPLSSLFVAPSPSRTLARRAREDVGTEYVGTEAFLSDVAALADAIARFERGRWILCTEDAYACAVGLCAVWQVAAIAVLPPNLEAGSLRELSAGVVGVLSDRALSVEGLPHVAVLGRPRVSPPRWRAVERNDTRLELCTSGSTGARKLVPKTLAQLESEIEVLERAFGAECADGVVIGTVSHQHIYGLLFRVLWPLTAGRTFHDAALVDPAQLAGALALEPRAILISSPAHLTRLPEFLELKCLRGKCGPVFSSGGPLEERTARIHRESLGRAPIEVLGSTETGGIAWRRQELSPSRTSFEPFEGVDVQARDGLLCVRSPRTGSKDFVPTGDVIALGEDGRFELLRREDRIVKLFDERVSLSEIETRLGDHELVDQAAAVVIERNGTRRIGLAVVLTAAGNRIQEESGKAALIASLRARLQPFFRATVLPRAWRFVQRLPEDAQGKSTRALVEALFAGPAEQRDARVARDVVTTANGFEVELEVPHDLWCLRGHFTGFPVVPGVVQLEWVIRWAGSWIGREPRLRAIEGLKFKQILSSGTRFRLSLERADDADLLRFRLWNEIAEFSSGRLRLVVGDA